MKELKNFILEAASKMDENKPKKNQDCIIFYVTKEDFQHYDSGKHQQKYKIIDCEEGKIEKTFEADLGRWHHDYHKWVYVNGIRYERYDYNNEIFPASKDISNNELYEMWVFNAKLEDKKFKADSDKIPAYVAYGEWLEKIKNELKSSDKIENESIYFTFTKEVTDKLSK